jgi:hypothetical protein
MKISNNPVPSYYMSDMQYSRLYALAYLDEQFRAMPLHGAQYCRFMAKRITELLDSSDAKLLAELIEALGGEAAYLQFRNSIPNAAMFFDVYCAHARALIPDQTVHEAVEENMFWAATNSIFYILNMHAFAAHIKKESNVTLLENNIFERDDPASLVRTVLLNMMFIKPVQIDPVPSVLDGYSFNTLENIIDNKKNRAITLPSNATCC